MEVLDGIRRSNLMRVIYIGLCFTSLFTAYSAGQNLITHIYSHLGYDVLGQASLFSIFAAFGLSNLVTSYYVKKITVKLGLVAGGATYSLLILAGTLTTYCGKYSDEGLFCQRASIYITNILGSLILGFGGGFLWICEATYVNSCADDSTRGSFNGVFFSLMQSSQIISSLLATFILGYTDQFTFYIVLCLFSFFSIIMFMFVKAPIPYTEKEELKQAEPSEDISQSIREFYSTIGKPQYRFLFMGMILSGLTIAFYINFLAQTVEKSAHADNENVLNQKVGYALIALAIGEVLSGVSIGRLADLYDKVSVLNLSIVTAEVALALTILAYVSETFWMAVLCGFFWGYADTALQTMAGSVIGSLFNGEVKLFSAFRLLQSTGVVFGCALAALIPNSVPLLYAILMGLTIVIFHVFFLQNRKNCSTDYLLNHDQKLMTEMKAM